MPVSPSWDRTRFIQGRYFCWICEDAMETESQIHNHFREHHPEHEHEPWACKFCCKTFATRGGLRSHEPRHEKDEYASSLGVRNRWASR